MPFAVFAKDICFKDLLYQTYTLNPELLSAASNSISHSKYYCEYVRIIIQRTAIE